VLFRTICYLSTLGLGRFGWFFLHCDNSLVHTTAVVHHWLTDRAIQVLEHQPYSPDLAPADFFYFPEMKEHLDVLHLTPDTFRNTWERVNRAIAKDDFAAAVWWWPERCKSVWLLTVAMLGSPEKMKSLSLKTSFLFNFYDLFLISPRTVNKFKKHVIQYIMM